MIVYTLNYSRISPANWFCNDDEAEVAKQDVLHSDEASTDGVVTAPLPMLDKWRMAVFNGDVSADEMNDYQELERSTKALNQQLRVVDAFDPEQIPCSRNTLYKIIR